MRSAAPGARTRYDSGGTADLEGVDLLADAHGPDLGGEARAHLGGQGRGRRSAG